MASIWQRFFSWTPDFHDHCKVQSWAHDQHLSTNQFFLQYAPSQVLANKSFRQLFLSYLHSINLNFLSYLQIIHDLTNFHHLHYFQVTKISCLNYCYKFFSCFKPLYAISNTAARIGLCLTHKQTYAGDFPLALSLVLVLYSPFCYLAESMKTTFPNLLLIVLLLGPANKRYLWYFSSLCVRGEGNTCFLLLTPTTAVGRDLEQMRVRASHHWWFQHHW